jgi:menaquinone-dependent protoporphyrinogen IX oxidase
VAAPRVLVVFQVCADHTAEVAADLAGELRAAGVVVDVRRVAVAPDPAGYQGVIVGGGEHGGGVSPELDAYVQRHRWILRSQLCALFLLRSTANGSSPGDGAMARRATATVST